MKLPVQGLDQSDDDFQESLRNTVSKLLFDLSPPSSDDEELFPTKSIAPSKKRPVPDDGESSKEKYIDGQQMKRGRFEPNVTKDTLYNILCGSDDDEEDDKENEKENDKKSP